MATLQALALCGIRNYDPEILQRINFQKPITLIHGKNGSGKTTIIQCLKYITTGSFPPGTQRGKAFIMDPKVAKRAQTIGDVRLRFRTAKGRQIIATKKSIVSSTAKGMSFKSTQQYLKTKDEQNQQIQINHRCADIDKQMPELLGMSKPILQNIVFCHQDESLWPFADNSTLKNIFDQLFDTKRFSRSMDNMKEALKDLQKQRLTLKGQMGYLSDRFKKNQQMRINSLNQLLKIVEESKAINQLTQKLAPIKQKLNCSDQNGQKIKQLNRNKGAYQNKVLIYKQQLQNLIIYLGRYYKEIPDLSQQQICYNIQKTKRQLKQLDIQKNYMESNLNQVKQKEDAQKNKKQIYTQIKRIKQIVNGFQNCRSIHDYNYKLKQIVKNLQLKQNRQRKLKNQINQLQIPAMTIPIINQQQFRYKTAKFHKKKQQFQIIQNKLWKIYSSLYTQSLKEINTNFEGSQQRRIMLQQKQAKLQANIQLKQKQLERYRQDDKKKPKQSKQGQILEIQYACITFQKTILQFMQEKGKCATCLRSLNDEQLETLKKKATNTIQKAKIKVQQLKQQNNKIQNMKNMGYLIEQNQKFLTDTKTQIQDIQDELRKQYEYKQYQQKVSINKYINRVLESLGLSSKREHYNNQNRDNKYCIDDFKEIVHKYRQQAYQLKGLQRQIKQNQNQRNNYKNLQAEIKIKQAEKSKIAQQLAVLEEETKNIRIIENISHRITQLLPETVKKQSNQSLNHQSSSQQLQNKINQIYQSIQIKKSQIMGYQYLIQYQKVIFSYKQANSSLQTITKQILQIQKQCTEDNQRIKQKNRLQIQIEKKKQRILFMSKNAMLDIPEEKDYLKKIIRFNAITGMVNDIQASSKAMERAISRLHNEKMDEVNRILYDVWQDVYNGGDIEFIRINSINQKKNKVGYSYSIVMKKNGQLLDMRGRCSMGQKVLASLIIRMALAQAFSANTHILALDEPTTNLDRSHIQKLAESIGNILQMQNSSLQLIIISHDIEFIRLLSRYTNSYIQVSRNKNNYSTIQKRDISELQFKVLKNKEM